MLAVGARVRLLGLQAKPELNGREGIIKDHKADTGRWTVQLGDGTDFAFKGSNLEVLRPGFGVQPSPVQPVATDKSVLDGFDQLLKNLETSRHSVFNMMVYCMEHASQHAALLAQRIARSLGKPGIGTKAYIARLFVVSDVLHNSKGGTGEQLGASLRELLPEACERLGRVWLRRIEEQDERDSAESEVRRVLKAWQDRNVLPLLYTKGLECLLFAQVFEISAREASSELDEVLRPKLTRWFAGLNQAHLPDACQQRGLVGKALSMATCRARLCHFERYWHLQPGVGVRLHGLLSAPHLNGLSGVCEKWDLGAARWKVRMTDETLKAVKQDNLLLDDSLTTKASQRLGAILASGAGRDEREPTESESVDGEPLTEAELAELQSTVEVDLAEKYSKCPVQFGYGVWTQGRQ